MEYIVDTFEVMRNSGEEPECDEGLSYIIKCLEDDIPYKGFFHEIYSCEEPFEYEKRDISLLSTLLSTYNSDVLKSPFLPVFY